MDNRSGKSRGHNFVQILEKKLQSFLEGFVGHEFLKATESLAEATKNKETESIANAIDCSWCLCAVPMPVRAGIDTRHWDCVMFIKGKSWILHLG